MIHNYLKKCALAKKALRALPVALMFCWALMPRAGWAQRYVVNADTVTFNEFEDHTWAYYSDKPDADYPDCLRSPDPRNVRIIYRGGAVGGGSSVAVSATESQHVFVYNKTLEKKAWGHTEGRWLTGNYAYRTIFNPFSKRPKVGSTYYGFNNWRIVSGGKYIGKTDGTTLAADELVNFQNFDAYVANGVSAVLVLEAQWTAATVVTVNGNVSGDPGFTGGTSETNFVIVRGSGHSVSGLTRNVTVMACNPDGTGATGASLGTVTGSGYDLKIENINLGGGANTFTARTGWFIVGRGCTGRVQRLYAGSGTGSAGQIRMRIESGWFNFVNPMSGGSANNNNYGRIIMGNDYDRATNDGIADNDAADNSTLRRLRVMNYVSFNGSGAAKGSNTDQSEWLDITIKSGYYGFSPDYSLYKTAGASQATGQDGFGLGIGGNTDNAPTYSAPDQNGTTRNYTRMNGTNSDHTWEKLMSFYVGRTRGGNYGGINRLLIEGGELSSVNGGGYGNNQNNTITYYLRMKDGWVKGALYGTASSSATNADTRQVITGGEVNGWIAGACNGTDVDNAAGDNSGNTYIYFGGTAECRSHRSDGVYNNAWGLVGGVEGGSIFASGRGTEPNAAYPDRNYCGSSMSTYAVVADDALVERNVCGGGYIGVAQQSHVYIVGGHVKGNVYGGAMTPLTTSTTWRTQNSDIRMYAGQVDGGIYGGHYQGTGNAGKIHQNTRVRVLGGQVGTGSQKAYVHGGGFGNGTSVGGNVEVTIGASTDAADCPTVYGEVYGGSALGSVNTNDANTTHVTMNCGDVYGTVYGGALGDASNAAPVNGKVRVQILGGTLHTTDADPDAEQGTGSVFGCNNTNGMPQSDVEVIVGDVAAKTPHSDNPHIEGNVFGGGHNATYVATGHTFTVTGYNGLVDHNVFGGGKGTTATVTGNTSVWLQGSITVMQNVYGGGMKASVDGNTNVKLSD